jgi:hypothetical protein
MRCAQRFLHGFADDIKEDPGSVISSIVFHFAALERGAKITCLTVTVQRPPSSITICVLHNCSACLPLHSPRLPLSSPRLLLSCLDLTPLSGEAMDVSGITEDPRSRRAEFRNVYSEANVERAIYPAALAGLILA